jgi:hypothetical protein
VRRDELNDKMPYVNVEGTIEMLLDILLSSVDGVSGVNVV